MTLCCLQSYFNLVDSDVQCSHYFGQICSFICMYIIYTIAFLKIYSQ